MISLSPSQEEATIISHPRGVGDGKHFANSPWKSTPLSPVAIALLFLTVVFTTTMGSNNSPFAFICVLPTAITCASAQIYRIRTNCATAPNRPVASSYCSGLGSGWRLFMPSLWSWSEDANALLSVLSSTPNCDGYDAVWLDADYVSNGGAFPPVMGAVCTSNAPAEYGVIFECFQQFDAPEGAPVFYDLNNAHTSMEAAVYSPTLGLRPTSACMSSFCDAGDCVSNRASLLSVKTTTQVNDRVTPTNCCQCNEGHMGTGPRCQCSLVSGGGTCTNLATASVEWVPTGNSCQCNCHPTAAGPTCACRLQSQGGSCIDASTNRATAVANTCGCECKAKAKGPNCQCRIVSMGGSCVDETTETAVYENNACGCQCVATAKGPSCECRFASLGGLCVDASSNGGTYANGQCGCACKTKAAGPTCQCRPASMGGTCLDATTVTATHVNNVCGCQCVATAAGPTCQCRLASVGGSCPDLSATGGTYSAAAGCGCACKAKAAGPTCQCATEAHGGLCKNEGTSTATHISGQCGCSCLPTHAGATCEKVKCLPFACVVPANTEAVTGYSNIPAEPCNCVCHAGYGPGGTNALGCSKQYCSHFSGCDVEGTLQIRGLYVPSCSCQCRENYIGDMCETRICHVGYDCRGVGISIDGAFPDCICRCHLGYGGRNCRTNTVSMELTFTGTVAPTETDTKSLSLSRTASLSLSPSVTTTRTPTESLATPTLIASATQSLHISLSPSPTQSVSLSPSTSGESSSASSSHPLTPSLSVTQSSSGSLTTSDPITTSNSLHSTVSLTVTFSRSTSVTDTLPFTPTLSTTLSCRGYEELNTSDTCEVLRPLPADVIAQHFQSFLLGADRSSSGAPSSGSSSPTAGESGYLSGAFQSIWELFSPPSHNGEAGGHGDVLSGGAPPAGEDGDGSSGPSNYFPSDEVPEGEGGADHHEHGGDGSGAAGTPPAALYVDRHWLARSVNSLSTSHNALDGSPLPSPPLSCHVIAVPFTAWTGRKGSPHLVVIASVDSRIPLGHMQAPRVRDGWVAEIMADADPSTPLASTNEGRVQFVSIDLVLVPLTVVFATEEERLNFTRSDGTLLAPPADAPFPPSGADDGGAGGSASYSNPSRETEDGFDPPAQPEKEEASEELIDVDAEDGQHIAPPKGDEEIYFYELPDNDNGGAGDGGFSGDFPPDMRPEHIADGDDVGQLITATGTFFTAVVTMRYSGPNTLNKVRYTMGGAAAWARCPVAMPGSFTVTLEQSDRLMPPIVGELTSSVGAGLAIKGALTFHPVLVLQLGIVTSLKEMSRCRPMLLDSQEEGDDDNYADYKEGLLNPFALSLGGPASGGRGYLRGSLVTTAGYAVLLSAIMLVYSLSTHYVAVWLVAASADGAEQEVTGSVLVGYPSALVAVAAFAMDGAVGAGTILGVYGGTAGDYVLGWAAVLAVLAYIGHVLYVTTRGFPSGLLEACPTVAAPGTQSESNLSDLEKLGPDDDRSSTASVELADVVSVDTLDLDVGGPPSVYTPVGEGRPSTDGHEDSVAPSKKDGAATIAVVLSRATTPPRPRWRQRVVAWSSHPTHEWLPTINTATAAEASTRPQQRAVGAWIDRYESYIADVKVRWYCGLELLIAATVTALGSLAYEDTAFCVGRGLCCVAVLLAQLIIMAVTQPPVHRWRWVLLTVILLLQTLSAILSTINAALQDAYIELGMDLLGVMVVFLLLISTFVDVALLLRDLWARAKLILQVLKSRRGAGRGAAADISALSSPTTSAADASEWHWGRLIFTDLLNIGGGGRGTSSIKGSAAYRESKANQTAVVNHSPPRQLITEEEEGSVEEQRERRNNLLVVPQIGGLLLDDDDLDLMLAPTLTTSTMSDAQRGGRQSGRTAYPPPSLFAGPPARPAIADEGGQAPDDYEMQEIAGLMIRTPVCPAVSHDAYPQRHTSGVVPSPAEWSSPNDVGRTASLGVGRAFSNNTYGNNPSSIPSSPIKYRVAGASRLSGGRGSPTTTTTPSAAFASCVSLSELATRDDLVRSSSAVVEAEGEGDGDDIVRQIVTDLNRYMASSHQQ